MPDNSTPRPVTRTASPPADPADATAAAAHARADALPVGRRLHCSDQPRTSLLPPAPGRHHWCVVIPPSSLPQFDGAGADARLHAELVEHLWDLGVGCARFDLFAPTSSVANGHPAAFGRQLGRTADVLERLARIDNRAEVTVLASGDGVDVALGLGERSGGPLPAERGSAQRAPESRDWPVLRGLLLVPPAASEAPEWLGRQAKDLARSVAHDERRLADLRPPGVTRQILRRLGW